MKRLCRIEGVLKVHLRGNLGAAKLHAEFYGRMHESLRSICRLLWRQERTEGL